MAMIVAAHIRIFTEDDDKDAEEVVTTKMYYGDDRILAQSARGGGQVWQDHYEQAFVLQLTPPVDEKDSGRLKIAIEKSVSGGATEGCGWNMSVSVTGTTDDDRTINLLNRTSPVRIGDGHPVIREWAFR